MALLTTGGEVWAMLYAGDGKIAWWLPLSAIPQSGRTVPRKMPADLVWSFVYAGARSLIAALILISLYLTILAHQYAVQRICLGPHCLLIERADFTCSLGCLDSLGKFRIGTDLSGYETQHNGITEAHYYELTQTTRLGTFWFLEFAVEDYSSGVYRIMRPPTPQQVPFLLDPNPAKGV